MNQPNKLSPILAYAYKRGHLEGQADMAKVIREKIRNNKAGNPYQLLVQLENDLLSIIEEVNTKVAKMRNDDKYE